MVGIKAFSGGFSYINLVTGPLNIPNSELNIILKDVAEILMHQLWYLDSYTIYSSHSQDDEPTVKSVKYLSDST